MDCIVLSGADLLAVTSLSDSPTASTQRECEALPVVWTVPLYAWSVHNACLRTVCVGVRILHMSLPCFRRLATSRSD